MSFLDRFARSEGPEPSRLPSRPDGTNPIHALLDEIGLPWRQPRGLLQERFGITPHTIYGWPVVVPDTKHPLVSGLLHPISVQAFERFAPTLPAIYFTALAWVADDTRANIAHVVEQLAPRLGAAKIGKRYNTLVAGWQSGAAGISLTGWPPEWQDERKNPAHAVEPRLATACHITIETGFRSALSERETAWLKSFVPLAQIDPGTTVPLDIIATTPAMEGSLEYVREPAGDLAHVLGRVGHSADRQALIFCHRQLHVIAAEDIIDFQVERTLPAKGGGGSRLLARCRTPAIGIEHKDVSIAEHAKPDGITDMGRLVAEAMGKPLVVGEYFYDV